MIGITTSRVNDKTTKSLRKMKKSELLRDLNRYGAMGVALLASATPVETNLTAQSWKYRIVQERNGPRVEWYNTNDDGSGTPTVVLIQYGHATKNGGYVVARDFINPAIQPMFDEIINEIWKRVMMA